MKTFGADVAKIGLTTYVGFMYQRRSRLMPRQQGKLIEHFVVGTTAGAVAEIAGVQANNALRFYHRPRILIASEQPSYGFSGEVEADESYFYRRPKATAAEA